MSEHIPIWTRPGWIKRSLLCFGDGVPATRQISVLWIVLTLRQKKTKKNGNRSKEGRRDGKTGTCMQMTCEEIICKVLSSPWFEEEGIALSPSPCRSTLMCRPVIRYWFALSTTISSYCPLVEVFEGAGGGDILMHLLRIKSKIPSQRWNCDGACKI